MFLVTFFLVFFLGYLTRIHRPSITTNNKMMKQIALTYIFPMLFMNSGLIQSAIQHLFYASIIYGAKKTILNLEVTDGITIIVDKYDNKLMCEPLSRTYKLVCAIYKLIYNLFSYLGLCTKIKPTLPLTINKKSEMNLVLVHGLNGSSDSRYIIRTANLFLKKNCRVFCMNARGEKGIFDKTNYTHFGLTDDLHHVTKYIMKNHEGMVFYIGFSQGGNMITKFIAEFKHSRILGGVAVCNPFNFIKLEDYSFNGTWIHKIALKGVCKQFKLHIEKVYKQNFKGKHLRELFDELIESNFLNYGSTTEYLKENSSEEYIGLIDKSLLFINADDDPVIPIEIVPKDKIFKNQNTGLITLQGGHLGFKSFFLGDTIEGIIEEFYRNIQK